MKLKNNIKILFHLKYIINSSPPIGKEEIFLLFIYKSKKMIYRSFTLQYTNEY